MLFRRSKWNTWKQQVRRSPGYNRFPLLIFAFFTVQLYLLWTVTGSINRKPQQEVLPLILRVLIENRRIARNVSDGRNHLQTPWKSLEGPEMVHSTTPKIVQLFKLQEGPNPTPPLLRLPYKLWYQGYNASTWVACSEKGVEKLRSGPIPIVTEHLTEEAIWEDVGSTGDGMKLGGLHWAPDCKRSYSVALVIPYRNRSNHLLPFLNHMHQFLQKQNLLYHIFLVEQVDDLPFNRGMLLNIGYRLGSIIGDYNCFLFSDIDLLPTNEHLRYDCKDSPKHLSAYVNTLHHHYSRQRHSRFYLHSIFGGVIALTAEQFRHANGFSNRYFGWGGEDNNFARRLRAKNLTIQRFIKEKYLRGEPVIDPLDITDLGKFHMLPHESYREVRSEHPDRWKLLQSSQATMSSDGLNTLKDLFTLHSIDMHKLYTSFKVTLSYPTDGQPNRNGTS